MESTRAYAGLFIIDPERNDTLDDVKKDITSIITDNSGSVTQENMMGKRTLAYPVKKKNEGIYIEIIFSAPPEAVSKMTRLFRINTNILRTLIDRK